MWFLVCFVALKLDSFPQSCGIAMTERGAWFITFLLVNSISNKIHLYFVYISLQLHYSEYFTFIIISIIMKKIISLLFISLFTLSVFSFAAEIKGGENVTVEWGKNDVYVGATNIVIANPIEGDLRAASNAITLDKTVSQDVNVGGNTVNINADIGDDLKVAWNQIIINSSIKGDVIVFGNTVLIWKDVVIGWDLIVASSSAIVGWTVEWKVRIYAQTITLSAQFKKDADLRYGSIELMSGAKIGGVVNYTTKAQNPALEAIATSGVFQVDMLGNKWDEGKEFMQENKKGVVAWLIAGFATFKFLSLLLISLILWFACKPWLARAAMIAKTRIRESLWIWLLTMICLPIVGLILLFTGILSIVGWLLLAAWFFIFMLIEVQLILVATAWLRNFYNKTGATRKDILWIVILSIVCTLISGIDGFLGLFALGALILLKVEIWNKLKTNMSDWEKID